MKLARKGQVGNLQQFILGIVGVAVILAVGLIVVTELRDSSTAGTYAYNSSNSILTKLATVPTWIGIMITVALAFIVLGYFYNRS